MMYDEDGEYLVVTQRCGLLARVGLRQGLSHLVYVIIDSEMQLFLMNKLLLG